MSFKEQVATDFETTFLNAGEFARICDWNGKKIKIVEAVSNNDKSAAEGVTLQKTQIICNAKDIEVPEITEEIILDSKEWIVSDVKKPPEHLIIFLERRVA